MSGISWLLCSSVGEWCVFLRFLQWASSRAAPSCCSAEDTEKRSPVSASPTRTSPTWAITLQPRAPLAKSLAASPGASSSASPSARPANRKARLLLPTEERALWIIDYNHEREYQRLCDQPLTSWQSQWVTTCTSWRKDVSGRKTLWNDSCTPSVQKKKSWD